MPAYASRVMKIYALRAYLKIIDTWGMFGMPLNVKKCGDQNDAFKNGKRVSVTGSLKKCGDQNETKNC